MLRKDKKQLQDFNEAVQYEWLETNGLGGWSGSSVIGAHTRRYHGLFVASTNPPAERTVLLSKLDEVIITGTERFELGCNLYEGDVVHPTGNDYLNSYTKGLFPQWIYEVNGVQVKKTVFMVHNENTVVVIYDVLKAPKPFTLELLPLMAARGYHQLGHAGPAMHWDVDFNNGTFHNQPDGNLNLYIKVPGSSYRHDPSWFNNFKYLVEEYRGLDCTEDLFNHGTISAQLKKADSLGIIISTEDPSKKDAHALLLKETIRKQGLLKGQQTDDTIQQLLLAADQFIVKRGEGLKTVIAGYHWFTDWGRDTMISLPGLCLSTGRFTDAKKILSAFAKAASMGMLPNRFQDNGEAPEYNNVDGTLWYFIAVYKYLKATDDKKFVLKEILPVLKDIIEWHNKGTRYNIHVTEDELLYAGEKGQQLTWMDARIGDWVVTPRMGKPVEIQALWYNALCIYSELLKLNKESIVAGSFSIKAQKVKLSFNELFWNKHTGYLFDVIDENGKPDPTLRPNQLFAISLPFALIDNKQAEKILKIVEEKLYTPVGLRSLPADDTNYTGIYGGDPFKRDACYHQGTVWSWLLGPFIDAVMKVYGSAGKAKAIKLVEAFKYHLNEGCLGTVSEIFDADAPHHPRGCVAQAWGVAEILRVINHFELVSAPKKSNKKTELTYT